MVSGWGGALVCKLDTEKVYFHVNCSFLLLFFRDDGLLVKNKLMLLNFAFLRLKVSKGR